ncbi:hypothetical protein ACFL3X_00825, partial [Gemmatimonadota bacterium]
MTAPLHYRGRSIELQREDGTVYLSMVEGSDGLGVIQFHGRDGKILCGLSPLGDGRTKGLRLV